MVNTYGTTASRPRRRRSPFGNCRPSGARCTCRCCSGTSPSDTRYWCRCHLCCPGCHLENAWKSGKSESVGGSLCRTNWHVNAALSSDLYASRSVTLLITNAVPVNKLPIWQMHLEIILEAFLEILIIINKYFQSKSYRLTNIK